MEKLIKKIDEKLFKDYIHKANKDVYREISINLTEQEKELFFEVEKYQIDEYFWYFEGTELHITYKKLAA